MSNTTYTVAQALATSATGIHVVDTAANIANNLANASLVARVSLFSMSANATVSAVQASALGRDGSQFSTNGYVLTVRDSVAQLTAAGNAAAETIGGLVVAVADTAANILAASGNPIIRGAASIALTANATVTLAQLLTLESWASFTAGGVTITLADSAANLLAFTSAEAKPALTVFQIGIASSVTAAQAIALERLSHFGIQSGATLTVTDTVANIASATSALATLFAMSGVSVNFADTMANLLARASSFVWLQYPNAHVTLSASATASAAQAETLASLPQFGVAAGQSLTIADTVQNLVTLTSQQAALAGAITLTGSATASVAQLAILAGWSHFSPGAGHVLTALDSLANLAALTGAEHALIGAEAIDDTVTNLLSAASAAFTGVSAITAELDGVILTAAQATALAALGGYAPLTIHANGTASTLTISDTAANLAAAAASIAALQADGATVTEESATSTNHQIVTAAAAAALVAGGANIPAAVLAVADTGPAIAAVASQIFGQGFLAITVTSGSFAGSMAQLLDPTLHFAAGSGAQLGLGAVASVAQAHALAALPGFTVAGGATLTVEDTIGAILSAAATLPGLASAVLATDSETVSAANAAVLAGLGGFSLHGNTLTVSDTAANLAGMGAGAIALAGAIDLAGDARIDVPVALALIAMGGKFSPNGAFISITDTAAALDTLAANPADLAAVNAWGGEAVLSAAATVPVATATALSQLANFNTGTQHLTISDSGANLLAAGAGVLALAWAVQLSQPSTVTAAAAASLEAMHNFAAGGDLTIADTPAHLAAMPVWVAAPASGVTVVPETVQNAADYAIDAAQLAAMLALPGLSLSSFGGTVAVTDTAAALAGLAAAVQALAPQVLPHLSMTMDAAATVNVATAEVLDGLPNFSLGGYGLTISDTAANIATLDANTRALATSIVTLGGSASLTVAQYESVVGAAAYSGTTGSLTVSDNAANLLALAGSGTNLTYIGSTVLNAPATLSVAAAQTLSTLPNLLPGNDLAIADTASNLLYITGTGPTPDDWAIEQRAAAVTLTANAVVTAAQAALLAQLGARFGNGGYTLTIQDTPAALATLETALGPIQAQVTGTDLAAGAWTLNLAGAAQLAALPHLSLGSASLAIADTVANLTWGGNAGLIAALIAAVPGVVFTLAGNDTASVAQAEALHALGSSFTPGGYALTIADNAGHLASLDAGSAALAAAITLSGSALVSVATFDALRALPGFSDHGNTLVIVDTAPNLLSLAGSDLSLASEIMLSATDGSLSAAQAETLVTLANFASGLAHIGIQDSAGDLLQATSGSQPTDWAGELAATSIALTGSATLTAAQAATLASLGSRLSLGGYTLTVVDTAANLLSAGNAGGLAMAGAVALAGNETGLTAASASRLAGLSNFSKGGYTVGISDTAANLTFAGYAAGLALADTVQLSAAAALSVTAAEQLIGLADFQVNAAAPITIVDTLRNLLILGSAALAHNNAILQATAIALSASTSATVAQVTALEALPQFGSFSLNGYTLTLQDSGRHLAAFTPSAAAMPAAYVMVGDATLSAAQAAVLAADNVQIGDNRLTVADTVSTLLSLSTAVNALATGLTLSAASTATAAQATQLEALAAGGRFTTGGYALTVTGAAADLLGLSAATQQLATTLALSESGDVVSAADLVQFAELGSRFSLAGHTMTVSDGATQLAALDDLERALAAAAVLDASATVTVATAQTLGALPAFSLGSGVTLTVTGSYAALETLPADISSIAALVVTGTASPMSAAAAAAFATAPGFVALPGIVVEDTVANLTSAANAGWQNAATGGYVVADSPADLIAAAASMLLTQASSVTLAGNAQVSAAELGLLAGIANFTRGAVTLTVADSAANIAGAAAAIAALASGALVDVAAPVTAAQAEALVALNAAHLLSFAGGVSLSVQDSLANLTNAANAAGLALASTVTVLGTVADLLTASTDGWGSANPYYELTASAAITAAQATGLIALGTHFLPNGFTLTVTGVAVADIASIVSIAAVAGLAISDTAAHVGADLALGVSSEITQHLGLITGIGLTDVGPLSAAAAAGVSAVAALLSGPALAVADSAAAVAANLAGLEALGTHLASVSVSDTAADVAAVASELAALGAKLSIALTDTTPVTVTAAVAAGLAPVAAELGAVTIGVSDTGANVAAHAGGLVSLGTLLGTLTLSDGTTTTAATAASIAPLDSHLGSGVTLSVADSAAAIAAAAAGLTQLQTAGRLGTVTAANQAAADVAAYGATLQALNATATISDTAAHVSAELNALEPLAGSVLHAIALTDGGTPDIAVSIGQLTTDAAVLALIAAPFAYAVTDTAAAIAADLGAGGGSHLLGLGTALATLTIGDSTTLTLPAATLLAAGVDDSAGAVLAKLTGSPAIAATGVSIADFASLAGLAVAVTSFAVADTGAAIAADLALGGGSALLAHLAGIVSIAPGGGISLAYATETAAHVNDGAGSVFSKMPGASLTVTGVPVAAIGAVLTTGVVPVAITVSDTAAAIGADLGTAAPVLVQDAAAITAIAVSPSGAVTLDAAHALAAGVDDGAGSVFGKMSGGTLDVTGATVAELAALHALYAIPASVAVSDSAADIGADLMLGAGSQLEVYAAAAMVTAIAVTGGPVSLDDSYVTSAIAAALALLPAASLDVANVPVANIASVAGLAGIASLTVSDSAANIAADLALNASSELALHHAVIGAVTVTGGPVVLTGAQALAASAAALALLPAASLDVTGVAVADIASIVSIAAVAGLAISDTAAHVGADLALGVSSEITQHLGLITGIGLTDVGPLSAAAAAGVSAVAALLSGPALAVADSAAAVAANLAGLEALGTHLASVSVSDTAADVAAVASELAALGGTLSIALTDAAPVTVTAAVAAGLAPVAAELGAVTIGVSDTGANVAAHAGGLVSLGTLLGTLTLSDGTTTTAATAASIAPLDSHLGSGVTLSVADSAAAIAAAAAGLTQLQTAGRLGTVTAANQAAADVAAYGATLQALNATATISDTAAHVSAELNALEPLAGSVLHAIALTDGGTPDIAVSIGQLTTDAAVLALIAAPFAYAVTDTAAAIAADLGAGGGSHLLGLGTALATLTIGDSTTLTLPAATLLAAGVDDSAGAVLAKLTGSPAIAATGVSIADFASLAGLAVAVTSFAVADTGAAIAADLALGGGSALLAHLAGIVSIAPGGGISLAYATETAAHVNDGAGSVFSKMPGASLTVTGVPVAAIGAVLTTGVVPVAITVSDTAAAIGADLGTAAPVLVQDAAAITAIAVSPSGAVTLDAAHALAGGVDDGAGSVFGKMSGGTLDVTGATVAALAALHALYAIPASVAVSDSAADIGADLMLGAASQLEVYAAAAMVTAIAVTGGPVSLDDSYVTSAIAAALALLPAASLDVANVPVANIASVAGLAGIASLTVSDSAANIAADLALNASSELALHHAVISAVTVTGGPVVLTGAQALAASAAALALLPAASLDVTGVAVADIASIVSIAAVAGLTISDTAAHVGADLALGVSSEITQHLGLITGIGLTDVGPLSAAAAAGVSAVAALLSGPALAVADSAAAVAANLAGLEALGTHLASVSVSDTAADVAAVASELAALGAKLSIALTDTTPVTVTAAVAAGLAPVAAELGAVTIGVSDTGANVAAHAGGLVSLGTLLGTVTLSDGDTTTAATAASIAPLDSHLGSGVTLSVADSAAAIAAAAAGLTQLQTAGRLGTVTAANQAAADVAAYGATLQALNAAATISDTAAHVSAELNALEPLAGSVLHAIALTDGGTPDIAVSIGQLTTDAAVLALIAAPFAYAVTDTAAAIAADLGAGGGSHLLGLGTALATLTIGDSTTLTLPAATLLAAGVDDSAGAVLAKLTGSPAIAATGVSIADFASLAGLTVAVTSFAVADTGAAIAADLALGGGSALLAHLAGIVSIAPGGGISLAYATETAAHVNDGAGSVFSKMPGASLTVTGVPVAAIGSVLTTGVAPVAITVSDTAAAIGADLGTAAPVLVQDAAAITAIAVSPSGAVTLDAAHALAAGVDDGAGSVFGKMSGGTLDVTGATVAALAALHALYAIPASVAVSDSAADIGADLMLGAASQLEVYAAAAMVTAIAVTGGPVSLDDSYVTSAIAAALALLPAASLDVANVPVANIASVAGLAGIASLTVSDSAANIAADLALNASSELALHHAVIGAVTVTGGPVVLTGAQVLAASAAALALLPAASLDVTGVAVADIASIVSIAAVAGLTISDTAAHVGADLALGVSSEITLHLGLITGIGLTDVGPLSAAAAAGVSAVAALLSGPALAVADNAAAVAANVAGLEALGAHLASVSVSDTAADVAAVASELAALGAKLSIALTDTTPVTVTAAVAAGLAPVAAELGAVTIGVSDTGANVAAHAGGLVSLGTLLGTLTLSDGTTTTAATAASIAPLDSHLGSGVTLSVADSAAAIAAAAAGLTQLQTAGRLGTVTAANQAAADVAAYGATLQALNATATISDTAAHVSAELNALEPLAGSVLHAIALTDGGTPDIAVSIGQLTTDAAVLALIAAPFAYAVTDTAAAIAADLGAGGGSHLLGLGTALATLTIGDSTTLTLPAATLLAAGVDDSAGAVLAKLTGSPAIAATGVSIADFASLAGLAVAVTSFAVADTGAAIAADLALGGGSALLAHLAGIVSIAPGGGISLAYATETAAHVNDGAGSVFSKMPGASLTVTGVPVAAIGSVLTTGVVPVAITVSDTAAAIGADLGTAAPVLVQDAAAITAIAVSPSGAVTLDAAHALAAGVDDGAGSVFGKMSGGTLDVTGATVAELAALHALYAIPASVAVSDSAADIGADLMLGAASQLEVYAAAAMVTAIAVTGGPVSLDDSYVTSAIAAALALLPAASLDVANVPVANIASVAGLAGIASLTVSDSAANIAADLALNASSELALHHAVIGAVTVTGGPVVLTGAQALAASAAALALLPAASLDVTGVAVADIASIVSIAAVAGLAISDTAAHVGADLALGVSSEITQHLGLITGIGLTDVGPLSAAAAAGVSAVAALLSGPALAVADNAAAVAANLAGLEALGTHLASVSVSDTAADVAAVASELAALGGTLSIALTDAAPVTVTAAVAAGLAPVAAELGAVTIGVSDTGAAIAAQAGGLGLLGTLLGTVTLSDGTTTTAATAASIAPLDSHLGSGVTLSVADSAAAIAAAAAGLTQLQTDGRLGTVTAASQAAADVAAYGATLQALNATATISDTAAHVSAELNALEPLAGSVLHAIALTDGGTPDIAVSIGQLTADAAVLALIAAPFAYAVTDTAANVSADLLLDAASVLYLHAGSIASLTVTGGTVDLPYSQLSGVESSALALLPANTLAATQVPVAQVATMVSYPGLYRMSVSDTAANIQADLASGASGQLETNQAIITSIVVTSGTVTLTDSQAGLVPAALAVLQGPDTLVVTGVAVADLGNYATLPALHFMTVSDTAGNIQTDLAAANSALEHDAALVQSIAISGGGSITLTGAEAAAVMGALAELPSASLTVTAAAVAQVAALGALAALAGMSVSDTAAAIQADLVLGAASTLETDVSLIGSIAVTGGTIDLTGPEAGLVMAALAKLPAASLAVTAVAVANIDSILTLGAILSSLAVADTGGAISTDLGLGASSVLETQAAHIAAVTVTSGSVSIADGTVALVTAALALLPAASLTVTAVPVAGIAAIVALGAPLAAMAVSDTGANVTADLISGGQIEGAVARIASIGLTSGSVALTDAQANAVANALPLLPTGSLTVSAVPVSDIAAIAALTALQSMTVQDTAGAIAADLANVALAQASAINANIGKIAAILVSSGVVTLTDVQAEAVFADLAKLPAASLEVTAVPVSDVAHIASLGSILAGMTVQDTAAAVQADLAGTSVLAADAALIVSIGLTGGPVTLTDAQAQSVIGVLDKLPAASLVVTGVPVAGVTGIGALTSLGHMTVLDSAATIVADLTGAGIIAAHGAEIATVTVTDSVLGVATAAAIYNGLPAGTGFNEATLTISDTAAALVAAQAGEPGMLSAAYQVTLSANASNVAAADATTLYAVLRHSLGGMTLGVADTPANLLNAAYAAGIDFATSVALNAPATVNAGTATQLAGLRAFDSAGPAITVQDTPANLLNAGYAAGLAIATTVMLNASTTVTAAIDAQLAGIAHFAVDGQHAITVQDSVANILALATPAFNLAATFSVVDTWANIYGQIATLESSIIAHGQALTTDVTDLTSNTIELTLSATQYAADAGVYESISNVVGIVKVVDSAAALAAIAPELARDAIVAQVDVVDTAANILSNLTALESIGSKFLYATLSDSSLNASEVSALLTIPNLQTGSLTITDTGSQIAAAIQANGAAGLAFLNNQTVRLSGNSIIAASDAVTLEELTSLNKSGFQLVVWDTATHLTDSADGYLAAVKNGLIDGVYLKTVGGTATITAATAATLLTIGTFHKDDPSSALGGDGATNAVIVSDTAAHLDSYYSTLSANAAGLSFQVSGSATVTDAVYNDLLTLGATMAGGQSLTVRDTAATIIAQAGMGGTPSITPAAWQLSGSASVSEANAVFLGNLAGFSAGAYTLTLTGSDLNISLSDAQAIGNLGSAFRLGGYQLVISGTVALLSGLSANAKLVVTPDITDTFSQIAGLTLGDGLLGGTVTVTDSETVTAATAGAFLALLGGSGIATAGLSFGGNVETVSDTLANIKALTSSTAWTSNAGVQADFTTALSGNQVVLASQTEWLAVNQSAIHFSPGSYSITIQDSAANLLDPTNVDGVTLASVWQLAGNDSTNAAGAETLLPDAKFQLNHVLTVSDTAANLLDGVLSGVITAADAADAGYGGSVQVTLSTVETLDATTAEALVGMPGFSNTGAAFSIADNSAYLLDASNLPAENDATSVTLAGNETVSASTAEHLAALPHFTLGSDTLTLASNDYADAPTLHAIADFGTGFSDGGFSLTMTQDDVSLTPTEYAALQADNVLLNGHALAAMPVGASVSASGGDVMIAATGVSGATLNVYAASGSLLGSSVLGTSSIAVTQAESGAGGAVVVTETMPGHAAAAGESAPIVAIDQATIITDAGAASFAATGGAGSVQVGANAYMPLYTAGSQPSNPVNPVFVYDPSGHTLSFDVGSTSIVLVTLGAATHPAALDASEIFVTHFV